MDPEQIYQEVLTEEQQKGSSPPVAEGRAKAARARAEAGSPEPKEAKWWAGAQPHLEGAEAPAAQAEPEPEPEPAPAAEVAPDEPATEAPAPPPEPVAAPAEAPVEQAPAEVAAAAPAEDQTAVTAPSGPAEQQPAAAAPARPAGVTHGVATGTRLRPEDQVATEAMMEGQAAVYERRKLIDELVATGVPAVAAGETGRERSPLSVLVYVVIPLIAIVLVVALRGEPAETPPAQPAPADGAALDTITSASMAFDTDRLVFPAGEESVLTLQNDDSAPHNVSVYETEEDMAAQQNALFAGPIASPGETIDYTIPALDAGEYLFHCDLHPNMRGTVTVE